MSFIIIFPVDTPPSARRARSPEVTAREERGERGERGGGDPDTRTVPAVFGQAAAAGCLPGPLPHPTTLSSAPPPSAAQPPWEASGGEGETQV